jgi:hypothetical protein
MTESVTRKAAALRADLAGPSATSLEGLLADRVVACWLQVHYADAAVAQAGTVSLAQAAFAQKRQDAANRRYLTAIAALATVRRLLPVGVEATFTVSEGVAAVPADQPGETPSSSASGANPVGAGEALDGAPDASPEPGSILAFKPQPWGVHPPAGPGPGQAKMTATAP